MRQPVQLDVPGPSLAQWCCSSHHGTEHQAKGDEAANQSPDQSNGSDGIAAPLSQGLGNGVKDSKTEGNEIARVTRHIDEKLAHGPGGEWNLIATLPA